jgi:hypothetical protein
VRGGEGLPPVGPKSPGMLPQKSWWNPNPAEPEPRMRSKPLLVVVMVFAWIVDYDNDIENGIEISSTVCSKFAE